MKTFKLFAHRTKLGTYQILGLEAAKKMSLEDEIEYVQIDEGTYPFLLKKVKKMIGHVGQNAKKE